MKVFFSFLLGIIGFGCILLGVSLSVGNNVFADISFDTQIPSQWYTNTQPNAIISAVPEPEPIPVAVQIIITQTRHSH